MTCCGGPASAYPSPNDRTPGGRAYQFNNPRTSPGRRPTFFSRRLHRVSALIQNPTSASLREVAFLIVALYALFRGFLTARHVHALVFSRPVASVCGVHMSGASCLLRYIWGLWGMLLYGWAGNVVPWAFVAAAVVFLAEAVIGSR